MNNFLTSFKSILSISFLLGMIILFFRYMFIPVIVFIIILKILSKFKFNKVNKSEVNKVRKKTTNKNKIIDGEFEDI